MCLEAVKEYGYALEFVPEHHKDSIMCLTALQTHPNAIRCVPEQFKNLIKSL